MSFKKTANATMENPVLQNEDWMKMFGKRAFRGCDIDSDHPFCKTASVAVNAQAKKIAADTSKYILSHCTIMASVMVEEEPFDYLIKPETSHLVNNNDDAWTNEVLKMSHRSFVGAFNFVEHFQNSKYAKGHILDAVLRKVNIADGGSVWCYYCDILVATDVTHERLVSDIREGKVRYLSMGCVTDLVICSYCGTRVTDANTYCNHLSFQKGTFLADDDGVPRRIAELCGHKTMPNGGVKFVEASWVATPAFPGAAKRNIVAEEWVGPKTPYTQQHAASGKFAMTASKNTEFEPLSLSEALLDADLRGNLRR
jgi:uncharacterized Zn-finger protein